VRRPMKSELFIEPEGYQASKALCKRFQTLVSSIMWPAMQTRPDIAHSAIVLSSFLTNPTGEHMALWLRLCM
jgi:hypothetical protein